jgi:DNA (cytosine-5)-methyltransferase 1
MSLGLQQAGFSVKLAFDNVPAHIKTYNENLGPHGRVLDASSVSGAELLELAELKFGELDLFSGGPPCQGFSKQRRDAVVLNDPRNHLVLDFARLVRETGAKSFIFENVQIFGQKRGSAFIQEIANFLSDYSIHCFFVCCSDFGLAQTRGRFLMLGSRREISNAPPVLETTSVRRTVRDIIGGMPSPPDDYSEHPDFASHLKCRITKLNEERFSHVPQGGGWQDIPWDLRLPCHRTTNPKTGGWPDVYGRLSWDGLCPTITVGFDSFTRGRYGHPEENRSITPREAARLQGFPDEFRFLGNRMDVRTQIGNAVPPPLARAAGQAIMRLLDKSSVFPKERLTPDLSLNTRQLELSLQPIRDVTENMVEVAHGY